MNAAIAGGIVAVIIAAIAAAFWPGVVMYDTVAQYGQVLSGVVDDWHPPVMVRLWQVLHRAGPGTAPMFALQVSLYAAGFALIVAALIRRGRIGAALATAILALSPLLLGWQMVVLKDGQMLGALLLAVGIVLHWHFAERPLPVAAASLVGVLLVYATLVRANAVFATVALAAFLLPGRASFVRRAIIALIGILMVIAVSPLVNDRLLAAQASGPAKSQPIFDLAAIAVASPGSPSPFTAAERATIAQRHCSKAFFWDPLGDETACEPVMQRLHAQGEGTLYVELAKAAAAHPVAYATHRLAHWNSTERWLVRSHLLGAAPPNEPEPNDLGIGVPAGPFAAAWLDAASIVAATPLGWPITWTALGLMLVPVAWRRRSSIEGAAALAILASALTLEASFLVVSIASDLRYHLWSMAAFALALILLSNGLKRRHLLIGAPILLLVAGAGIWTRNALAPAPDNYQAMIHGALD